ncbi:uncharacterized protein At2g29880-like [Apium graveolens]|uniref:uncharacterized protein At2g29880-like n=1 Tax=Apium graveolens TaxID=4045 RepID=UPI003D7C052D
MSFSSGFGYDPISKRFTAPIEVWEEYIKPHPKDGNLRYETFDDYEDLKIAIGNEFAVGKNAIGLGSSIEARTLEVEEVRDLRIDGLIFDVDLLVQLDKLTTTFEGVYQLLKKREQERTYMIYRMGCY